MAGRPTRSTVIDPAFFDGRNWPRADSGKVCIFEAIQIVGSTLHGVEWNGNELEACWWHPADEDEKRARYAHLHSPTRMNSGGSVDDRLARKRAIQLGISVEEWIQRRNAADAALAIEEAAWLSNKSNFHRLEAAIDWLSKQCRDELLIGFVRPAPGTRLRRMSAWEWNVDNPIEVFLAMAGFHRRQEDSDLTRRSPGASLNHIFFDRAELLNTVAKIPGQTGRQMAYAEVVDWCRGWQASRKTGGVNAAWKEFHADPRSTGVNRDDYFRKAWEEAKG